MRREFLTANYATKGDVSLYASSRSDKVFLFFFPCTMSFTELAVMVLQDVKYTVLKRPKGKAQKKV